MEFSLKLEDISKFKKITNFIKSFSNEVILYVDRYGMKVKARADDNLFVLETIVRVINIDLEKSVEIAIDSEHLHKVVNSLTGMYEFKLQDEGKLTIRNETNSYSVNLIDPEFMPTISSDIIYDNIQMLESEMVVSGIKSAIDIGETFVLGADMVLKVSGSFCEADIVIKPNVETDSVRQLDLTKKQLVSLSKLSKLNKKINISMSDEYLLRAIVIIDTIGVAKLYLK
tara:strand:- start:3799 stop:4482 length:684 start_codon:yes stop_codon:yes gene_type:complete